MGVLRSVWLGPVPYRAAWSLQRRVAQARRHGEIDSDCLLLLEHPPVYTMGRTGSPEHVPHGPERLVALGAEYIPVDRGGSVTFHGPGQLVAYPIVRVADAFPMAEAPGRGDVIRYVRALEDAVIATSGRFGVSAGRRRGHTGVWVGHPPLDKLAAIGIKQAGGVTTHGVAFNVTTDLGWFDHIVPCGISDAGVTSLQREGAQGLDVEVVSTCLAAAAASALDLELIIADSSLAALVDRELAAAAAAV